MLTPRRSLFLCIALAGSVLAGVASVAANEPKIGKPIHVPPTKMPPLPPADAAGSAVCFINCMTARLPADCCR